MRTLNLTKEVTGPIKIPAGTDDQTVAYQIKLGHLRPYPHWVTTPQIVYTHIPRSLVRLRGTWFEGTVVCIQGVLGPMTQSIVLTQVRFPDKPAHPATRIDDLLDNGGAILVREHGESFTDELDFRTRWMQYLTAFESVLTELML